MTRFASFRWVAVNLPSLLATRSVNGSHPVNLLLCICDHYEPGNGLVDADHAAQRVKNWVDKYLPLFSGFHDSDGRPPRHTFFYPIEMYRPSEVDQIAGLCRSGFGEVEVHLHHDNDTADNLRKTLLDWKQTLRDRHGLLPRRRDTGQTQYAFIHGNWALDNSLPGGRACGVNNELDILRETGCYADFTLPSYPSAAQTRKINSIYYGVDDPNQPKSHDWGVSVGTAKQPDRSLMLFQGPLLFNWQSRKFGIIPRVENGNLQGNQHPSEHRLNLWLKARVQISSRPDWYFVKLHTHGATEQNQAVLLGEPMVRFHEMLARRAAENPNFHYHYVTAREMYNLAKAAEAGWTGSVNDARDYLLTWPNNG
jgi:hypothetical protein